MACKGSQGDGNSKPGRSKKGISHEYIFINLTKTNIHLNLFLYTNIFKKFSLLKETTQGLICISTACFFSAHDRQMVRSLAAF
jgi:hypothetical protein